MTDTDIKHFLVILDATRGCTQVEDLGADYDAAQQAYAQAERQAWGRFDLDVVLLSADSLQTVKRTHSSYFDSKSLDEQLAA